jgi:hypothetical protein
MRTTTISGMRRKVIFKMHYAIMTNVCMVKEGTSTLTLVQYMYIISPSTFESRGSKNGTRSALLVATTTRLQAKQINEKMLLKKLVLHHFWIKQEYQ